MRCSWPAPRRAWPQCRPAASSARRRGRVWGGALGGGPGGRRAAAAAPGIGLLSVGDSLPFHLGVGAAAELVAGTYRGSVTVQRPDVGDARMIPVTLTLTATTPLDGRWVGVRDSVTVILTLVDGGGVSGTGTLEPRDRSLTVTGTYAYPSLALRLVAGTDTTV